ncbi:hypothetical protein XELAEV_18023385mg [Xenopus laevis]|uniref:Uncharacterized protein n=1 Tax=Xenopus laevis TaxID=8355 RepID=A0A974D6I8_XENLA|nr:hypothetical protein XELAEV_18023385mg [Xenopus laevis]
MQPFFWINLSTVKPMRTSVVQASPKLTAPMDPDQHSIPPAGCKWVAGLHTSPPFTYISAKALPPPMMSVG